MKIHFLNKYNEISIYALIVLLISGPALPDILSSFIAIFTLYMIIKEKNTDERIFILFYPFLFLILPNLFSVYFPDPLIEQLINLRYVFFSLFIILYYDLNIENLIKFLLGITVIISFDLIFQFIFKFNIIGIDIYAGHNESRASSFFGDELIAGSYILKLCIPIIGYYLFKKNYLFSIILIIFYLCSIIATGERMSFLLFNFGIFLFTIIHINKQNYLYFLSFLIISIFIFLTAFNTSDRIKQRALLAINDFTINKNGSINSQHLGHYIIGYHIFKENVLFGTGHKTFREECKDKERLVNTTSIVNKGCATHPHNIYIELLSDSGVFGLISFLFLIGLIMFKCIKNKIYKSKFNGFFVTFILIIWPLSTAGNFFNNRVAILNFLIIGFVLYFCKSNLFKKENKISLKK